MGWKVESSTWANVFLQTDTCLLLQGYYLRCDKLPSEACSSLPLPKGSPANAPSLQILPVSLHSLVSKRRWNIGCAWLPRICSAPIFQCTADRIPSWLLGPVYFKRVRIMREWRTEWWCSSYFQNEFSRGTPLRTAFALFNLHLLLLYNYLL